MAIYTARVVKQGRNGLCVMQLYPSPSRYTVLYNAVKHRTIQGLFMSDVFQYLLLCGSLKPIRAYLLLLLVMATNQVVFYILPT